MTEPTEDPEQMGDPTLPDGPLPVTSRIVKSGTGSVTVLSAAMLAVGEILEPEKAAVEIAEQADDQTDVLDIELSFGDLPPIDEL
ncbi:MAG: hypothetical protein AAGG08_18695 [Actinomycetota bacterium]